MVPPRSPLTPALAVLVGLSVAAGSATATEDTPLGPPLVKVRYDSEIRTESGEEDVDTFAAALLAGTKVKATAKAARKSALAPRLALVSETGDEIDAGIRIAGKGRKAVLPTYDVPTTGVFGVRLWGDAASKGSIAHFWRCRAQPIAFESIEGGKPRTKTRGTDVREQREAQGIDGEARA